MYMEGSTKGFLAILFAILLVVCIAFWPQAKFMGRFLFDLIIMNAIAGFHSLLDYLRQQWPFGHPS